MDTKTREEKGYTYSVYQLHKDLTISVVSTLKQNCKIISVHIFAEVFQEFLAPIHWEKLSRSVQCS